MNPLSVGGSHPLGAEAASMAAPSGTGKDVAEKVVRPAKSDQRAKARLTSLDLRSPEGPLFHGGAKFPDFFRKL